MVDTILDEELKKESENVIATVKDLYNYYIENGNNAMFFQKMLKVVDKIKFSAYKGKVYVMLDDVELTNMTLDTTTMENDLNEELGRIITNIETICKRFYESSI